MMFKTFFTRFVPVATACLLLGNCSSVPETPERITLVNKFIGTAGNGCISPLAAVPFGMVQLGADTRPYSSGYHYQHDEILGFSHVHKSGAGCGDFLDILFMPLPPDTATDSIAELRSEYWRSKFSHDKEWSLPGYYGVNLHDDRMKVELTASDRCGLQRYRYAENSPMPLIIDLEYGSRSACTIQSEHDVDTVYYASLEMVDDRTVRGCRLTNGFAPHQHVYFYTVFSSPIESFTLYSDNIRQPGVTRAEGMNLKAVISFEKGNELEIKTGISAVDLDGAERNYRAEAKDRSFETVKTQAFDRWADLLGTIDIETPDPRKKELFYTALYNTMLYPMLYSDTDFRFRGPDDRIHRTDGFNYYGAVMGLWDTFRAACPLEAVLRPDIIEDYVKTALEHYKHAGQLPIWTLAGAETYQMIGLHSMPLITNAYLNGIRNFDTELALQAMTESAMKDSCGTSMGYFVGLRNYKKYGYVPCDMEMEAVARTLEYAYDDHAIAQFARMTGDTAKYELFRNRSFNYQNVIDPETLLARGRMKNGQWRTPFYPLRSSHRNDDYCEGNAWQWTFFVPHDVEGLAEIMGGKKVLARMLDSLFTTGASLEGESASGDITGLIGQYAHGNEPGHHTIYMYNRVGEPEKTQFYVHKVLTELYDNTPEGICGNEDTGQMSAWYVFSAMGFYPMDPVSGQYELGTPLFEKTTLHLPSGKDFTVTAENLGDENIFVDEVRLNGKKLERTYITFDELLAGGTLTFRMKGKND